MTDPRDAAPQPPPVPTDSEPIYRQVIADIEAKAEGGLAKYGTYLQSDNGRDHLADAYQEGIDGIKYLKCAIVERRALLTRIATLEAQSGNAFVAGAKWWEWQKSNATMWQCDQQAAYEEAQRRGFVFKPILETFFDEKIAALEAQLAEAQRLIACLADKPEDRLYHAQDRTWWRREGMRLVPANPPAVARAAELEGA